MTERTVEVEVTQTEEERVSICDHCGLEVEADDEEAVTLLPVENDDVLHGDVVVESDHSKLLNALVERDMSLVKRDTAHETVHYHGDCLADATLAEGESRAVTWRDLESPEGGPVALALTTGEVITMGSGIMMASGGLFLAITGSLLPGIPLAAFGLLLTVGAVQISWSQANDPMTELNHR